MRFVLSLLLSVAAVGGCTEQPGVVTPTSAPSSSVDLELTAALASSFASLALTCLDREYPNKPSNIVDGDDTVRPPRQLTPAFFGCFDWHSSVHGHWALVRLLRTQPTLPEAATIRERLDAHFDAALLGRELVYFEAERNRTFERPYGWAWLLRLGAELAAFDDPQAHRWQAALEPLTRLVAARAADYLNKLSKPIRSGVHPNTAFAMIHMLDFAVATHDDVLRNSIVERGRAFYLGDRACPVSYEPSGEDFLSPCLAEADLMRRILPREELGPWLDDFLPLGDAARLAPVLTPPEVRDLRDPLIGHLIGLGLSRAWMLRGLATALPAAKAELFLGAARRHERQSLEQMQASGYGGEHWLASFAILDLTGVGR